MVGKRACIARSARLRTVPSPTPASKTRTAGGRGLILPSSIATRLATTHFSLHVLTKRRYFCRLSKKRKLACPLPASAPEDRRVGSRIGGNEMALGGPFFGVLC